MAQGGLHSTYASVRSGGYEKSCDPEDFIFSFLQNESATVTIDMDVNATSTAIVQFRHEVPPGEVHIIRRVNIQIWDVSANPNTFGAIDLSAGTGVGVKTYDSDDTVLKDYGDGETIRSTSDFSLLAGTDTEQTNAAANLKVMHIRWTIARAGATLHLTEGQYFAFEVGDDLTGLDRFRVKVQGILGIKT